MTIFLGVGLSIIVTLFYWFVWQRSQNKQDRDGRYLRLKFSPRLSWSDHFIVLGVVLYAYASYYFYLKYLYVANLSQVQTCFKYSKCCIDCAVISATFSFLFYVLLTYIVSGLKALEEFDSNHFEKLVRYSIAFYSGGGLGFIQLFFSHIKSSESLIYNNISVVNNMSVVLWWFVMGLAGLLVLWYLFSFFLFELEDLIALIIDDFSLIVVLSLSAWFYEKLSKVFVMKEPYRMDGEYALWFVCLMLVALSGVIHYNYVTKIVTKRILSFVLPFVKNVFRFG